MKAAWHLRNHWIVVTLFLKTTRETLEKQEIEIALETSQEEFLENVFYVNFETSFEQKLNVNFI